jgi:hypothetical protein
MLDLLCFHGEIPLIVFGKSIDLYRGYASQQATIALSFNLAWDTLGILVVGKRNTRSLRNEPNALQNGESSVSMVAATASAQFMRLIEQIVPRLAA